MKFKGQIIVFVKDLFGCVHLVKKNSKSVASFDHYLGYIQSLEKKMGPRLVKTYIVNKEGLDSKVIWSSYVWREDLNERFLLTIKSTSPIYQKIERNLRL